MARPRRPLAGRSAGTSLLETLLALALAGILCLAGAIALRPDGLAQARYELDGCLDEAFHLARARGAPVTLTLKRETRGDTLPLRLPRGVRWGKPPWAPLPPDMDPPTRAAATGEAHGTLTVTARRTATAACWFLHDGRDVLCVRLSGRGRIRFLRWRHRTGRWERARMGTALPCPPGLSPGAPHAHG